MMAELFALSVAFVIGWGYLRIVLGAVGTTLLTAMAFPVGIAIWGVVAALSVMMPFRYSVTAITLVCLAGVAVANWKKGPRSSLLEGYYFAWGLMILVSLGAFFVYFDFTGVTTDSMFVLSAGKQIIEQGELTQTMKGVLASFAIYLSLLETAAFVLGLDYFKSFLPVCLVSTLAIFIIFAIRAKCPMGKTARVENFITPFLGVIVLITTYAFLWHGFYVKASPVYTLFLFLCCGATFFAHREADPRWLYAVLPAALATTLLRMEAGLTMLPMLVVVMAAGKIPLRKRLWFVISVSAVIAIWYAFLVERSFGHGLFSVYELVALGALPTAFAATAILLSWLHIKLGSSWPDWLIQKMPLVMCGVLTLFIFTCILMLGERSLKPLEALYCYVAGANAGVSNFWSGMFILLLLIPFLTRGNDAEWIFAANAGGFILLVFSITVIAPWKHCGVHDSANRILTQIMPIVLFYFVLRFGDFRSHKLSRY
ncbi:MAG: hypothetical protein CBC23_004100 [Rhodospirillaceae bacterium TMED63]|nr:MAG: hypothetical protein CBC23_004100 [Rhodospirillaceae bacterium TMED63]